MGLSEEDIAKMSQYKPTSKLEKDGNGYVYTNVSPSKTKVVKFKSGEEQDDEIREGLTVKSTYTVAGNTVTQVIRHDVKEVTFKREYTDDTMKVTITSNFWDGVATRYYSA